MNNFINDTKEIYNKGVQIIEKYYSLYSDWWDKVKGRTKNSNL